jgi:hypothetical protein
MKTIVASKTRKGLRSELAFVRLPLYAVTGPGTIGQGNSIV